MRFRLLKTPLVVCAAVLLVLAGSLVPLARSQIQAQPSYVAIGVSASGNTSTVWFHDPSSRQAVACQTVASAGTLSAIHCITAKLP
jgi:hypothetical protein